MEKLIVANWKMNPEDVSKAREIAFFSDQGGVILCPPVIFLNEVKKEIKKATIGAQDVFWERKGSFTGETSALMLKNIGCKYVIIGHSERRRNLKEDNSIIEKKMKALIEEGITPILCIGETREERDKKEAEKIVAEQLSIIPKSTEVIIAYEPVWAIGSGDSCDWELAKEMRSFISDSFKGRFSKILYGGSVNSENCSDYLEKSLFDGLLVGSASLDHQEFKKIIEKALN